MSDIKEIFTKLSENLSESAIQKTDKKETKKGYDTTGYGYQFCVDRLNELLQEKWGFEWEILEKKEGRYKSGMPFTEICVKMSIWIIDKENKRSCAGGHISSTFTDALKGAITNAFKKTVAFWGVGSIVYRGELDDDNQPYPEKNENRQNFNKEIYFDTVKCLFSKHKENQVFTKDEIEKYKNNAIAVKDNLDDLKKLNGMIKNVAMERINQIEKNKSGGQNG